MHIKELPPLLTLFEGGFYGGLATVHNAPHAIIWAPKDRGETREIWHPEYIDIPGAMSCFDSMANTVAMAAAGSPLAKWALGLDINGKTDWVIPAVDILEPAYRIAKPGTQPNYCSFKDGYNASSIPVAYPYTATHPLQTAVAAFQTGGAEAFEEEMHWSSTQYSSYDAYIQYFNGGGTNGYGKKFKGVARAVRLIPVTL